MYFQKLYFYYNSIFGIFIKKQEKKNLGNEIREEREREKKKRLIRVGIKK